MSDGVSLEIRSSQSPLSGFDAEYPNASGQMWLLQYYFSFRGYEALIFAVFFY